MRLIITEKYNAAEKIASILCPGRPNRTSVNDVPVFKWDDYRVMGLAGHIVETDFTDEHEDWNETHPKELVTADIVKQPSKQNLVTAVKQLGKQADEVIIATDFDREGELIGTEAYELVESVNNSVTPNRALFSSLTPNEVQSAFNDTSTIDRELAAAGEARQRIDLRWGASLTRYLTLVAERNDGIISVGRVQTPTLKIVVDREREIQGFDPDPYWEIYTTFTKPATTQDFDAQFYYYDEDDTQTERVWDETRATRIETSISNAMKATVDSVETTTRSDNPPIPFNTTEFIKAANAIDFDAEPAMDIAESLYDEGYITYPRTDNTVYADDMDTDSILESLSGIKQLHDDADSILSQDTLSPTEGDDETTDHPPIHPTTTTPSQNAVSDDEWEIYELVARRFLATFAAAATWERERIDITVDEHRHKTSGKKLVDPGYHAVYPYFDTDESNVPDLTEGDVLQVKRVEREDKETQPPNRYGQSRLIEKMESEGLGTKSTRHRTIEKLFDRGYLHGSPPKPTELAMVVIDTIESNAPDIASTEMTSQLEDDMAAIADGEKGYMTVTNNSKQVLTDVFESLMENKSEIKETLQQHIETTDDAEPTAEDAVGECGECGGLLVPVSFEDSQFISCSEYPECENTYPLPNKGRVHLLDEECDTHGFVKVKMIAGSQTHVFGCPACQAEKAANAEQQRVGDCVECGDGELVVKLLGSGTKLVGCDSYPDCEFGVPVPSNGDVVVLDAECDTHGVCEIQIESAAYDDPWELGCPICNYESYSG